MTARSEWSELEDLWRADRTSPAGLDAMIGRTRRARRELWLMRRFSTALAVIALAIVGAALRHAGNPFEIALGLVVGIGIGVVWLMEAANQRRAGDKVEAPTTEYVAVRRALCAGQERLARLGWLVTLLDLVFLIPWWIGGIAVHGAGFHPAQLLTMWMPLALMGTFVWWTIRARRRARAELARLADVGNSA
jgi:formate hydrogenlyase subunit 4